MEFSCTGSARVEAQVAARLRGHSIISDFGGTAPDSGTIAKV